MRRIAILFSAALLSGCGDGSRTTGDSGTQTDPPITVTSKNKLPVGLYRLTLVEDKPIPQARSGTACSTRLTSNGPLTTVSYDSVVSGLLTLTSSGTVTNRWTVHTADPQAAGASRVDCDRLLFGSWKLQSASALVISGQVCFIDGCDGPIETLTLPDTLFASGTALTLMKTNDGVRATYVKE